jgi:hypothetical protein
MSPVRRLEPLELIDDRQPRQEDVVAQANIFSARFGRARPRLVKPQLSKHSARRLELVRGNPRRLKPAA